MKKLLIIILLFLGISFAQTYEDVVILKNGSEIHGIIIEQKPNEYIKIQSGKNIFVYTMEEIELIKKEVDPFKNYEIIEDKISDSNKPKYDAETGELIIHETTDIANKTFSINLGFVETANFLSIRKDFKISKSSFVTTKVGGHLNLYTLDLGIRYEPKYNEEKGFSILSNVAYGNYKFPDYDFAGDYNFLSFSVTPSYQWRLGNTRAFFNLGFSFGYDYDLDYNYFNYFNRPILYFSLSL